MWSFVKMRLPFWNEHIPHFCLSYTNTYIFCDFDGGGCESAISWLFFFFFLNADLAEFQLFSGFLEKHVSAVSSFIRTEGNGNALILKISFKTLCSLSLVYFYDFSEMSWTFPTHFKRSVWLFNGNDNFWNKGAQEKVLNNNHVSSHALPWHKSTQTFD